MNHVHVIQGHLLDIWNSACAYCFFKLGGGVILALSTFLFGVENFQALYFLVGLMFFDLITGMAAAYKNGYPIESRKALKSATKLAVYGLMFSSSYFTESIVPGVTLIDEAMISFLALTELVSITENAGKMGYQVPQKLLNQLKNMRGESKTV